MKISVSIIDSLLQAEDVEGLLNLGAPKDEYSGEAKKIESALRSLDESVLTPQRVAGLIEDIWQLSFGPFSEDEMQKRRPALMQVARHIVDFNGR